MRLDLISTPATRSSLFHIRNDMNIGGGEAAYQIYPASHFTKAPTYKKWVKLTAADVQDLQQEPSFEGQSIYFHLNHPIEFVYVIGPVVAIDHVTTKYNTYFTMLEIDDGSGSIIEVKITYKGRDVKQPKVVSSKGDARLDTTTDDETNADGELDPLAESHDDYLKPVSLQSQRFETTVPNLVITSSQRTGWRILLNGATIEVGTVLKVKGTLQRFRDSFQLQLKRAFVVSTIDEEIAAWQDYADFCTTVLSKPWVISESQLCELEREQEDQVARERKAKLRRNENEKRKRVLDRKTREREARKERRRVLEAREMDGNALDKTGWKPYKPPVGHDPTEVGFARKPSLDQAENISPQTITASVAARVQASSHNITRSGHAAAQRATMAGTDCNDGFKKPALPAHTTGFIRPKALLSAETASMPWRHEIHDLKPLSELPMAGPALGTNRTSRMAASINGEHSGLWRHQRTNNPPYKKPVPQSRDTNSATTGTTK